ncbi:hypothetical protein FHP29_03360 [Nocardioides albidus]|uniref:Uncharacterized protein n=1 Tax=Nocardioides albidus TaxID=1517589 RepID=A0A5C4WFU4_9ACTN|nr:hypothetical protein [Nocardioides albidus]TNM47220.1 hypothetical protein FHP29_03360 [Nocardioides albidus]
MDLGTRPDATADLLSRVRDRIHSRNTLIIEEWEDITTWASDHVVTGPAGVATITEGYLDTGIPIVGAGAPLVSEFALRSWSRSSAGPRMVGRRMSGGSSSAPGGCPTCTTR